MDRSGELFVWISLTRAITVFAVNQYYKNEGTFDHEGEVDLQCKVHKVPNSNCRENDFAELRQRRSLLPHSTYCVSLTVR